MTGKSEKSAREDEKRVREAGGEVKKRRKKRHIFVRELIGVGVGLTAYVIYATFFSPKVAPVVRTWTGEISGRSAVSREGRVFYEYLGIPYAQPPTRNLRFQSPRRPLKWTGVRDGTKEGPYCLQVDLLPRIRRGDEDCLYLNVYTPVISNLVPPTEARQSQKGSAEGGGGATKRKSLPVLVFFHGGGFVSGGLENFGAHYFMDEETLLVTLHYRLGVFGFLNTGDTWARGNMGLKDQVAALHWIQQNIAQFGGDPNQVTIFGESAGGASVHFHMMSHMSRGLFQSGISQSATSLLHFVFNREKGEQNEILSRQTGCSLNSSEEFVSCLRNRDPIELVELQRWLVNPPRNTRHMFLPSIENVTDSDAFLTEDPLSLLRNGSLMSRVPWMTGINSEDGLLLSAELMTHPAKLDEIGEDWGKMADYLNVPANATLLNEIKEYYFDSSFDMRSVSARNLKALEPLTTLYSDRIFFTSNHVAAVLQSKHSPVYLYFYSHRFQISMIDIMKAVRAEDSGFMLYEILLLLLKNWTYRTFSSWDPRFPGVAHAEEMLLQFSILPLPHISRPCDSADYRMSRELVRTWVQFATDPGRLSFGNVTWSAVRAEDREPMYMNLNISNPSMIPEPFHRRIHFWKSRHIY